MALEIRDSRRLTGPNLFWREPGAALEAMLPGGEDAVVRLASLWRQAARRMTEALDWNDSSLAARVFPGGATLALSAPPDCLFAATEANEWAVAQAAAALDGGSAPAFDEAQQRIARLVREDANPRLRALSLPRNGAAYPGSPANRG